MTDFIQLLLFEKRPRNSAEKFFYENTSMIYVDMPYYDFVTNKGEIKVEVLGLHYNKKIKFKIRMGEWRKSLKAEFIVSVSKDRIYFGEVNNINDYLHKTMSENVINSSYRPRNINRSVYFYCSPEKLEDLGLLKSIPLSEYPRLEDSIINEHEEKINQQLVYSI